MSEQTSVINDVSDTALWVASYRAVETSRPDALFQDPLAEKLAGEKGRQIAARMLGTRYVAWSVVIRTCIIDAYIEKLVGEGIDTIINLGAGLDTRPYRLALPAALRWIEVDYPHMIELKKIKLAQDRPKCQLERVSLDLADIQLRQNFFTQIATPSKNILIITEGVLPYLTPEQVASLAQDLRAQKNFRFWIADYMSPETRRYMQSAKRKKQMKNAPFVFFPENWTGFFKDVGWQVREIRYLAEESEKRGRELPAPWWARLLYSLMPAAQRQKMKRHMGYVILEPT